MDANIWNLSEQLGLHVGVRVSYRGALGTVRYIGRLGGRDGGEQWVGVEWDDADRGKHSGTNDGIRYFNTMVPNAATFVKRTKMENGGRVSLLQAARIRVDDARDHTHRHTSIVVGKGIVDIADEGSAEYHLAQIKVLDVSHMGVAAACVDGETPLAQVLPKLTDLQVTNSLFNQMSTIIAILRALPSLLALDVSNNYLHSNCENEQHVMMKCGTGEALHQLQTLVLNRCSTDWIAIAEICNHIHGLHDLRLHACKLETMHDIWELRGFAQRWAQLRVLDLDRNQVEWDSVRKLSQLQHLAELYISENNLEDINDDAYVESIFGNANAVEMMREGQSNFVPFPSLHTFSVARNRLNDWKVITALEALPRLTHLRMSDNPISPHGGNVAENTVGTQPGWYLRVIARIGRLKRLDGSDVTADERLHAERRYMREELLPMVQSKGIEYTKKVHPRLTELLQNLQMGIARRSAGGDILRNGINCGEAGRRLASDVVTILFEADEQVLAQRRTAWRILPRHIDGERLLTIAKMILRIRNVENTKHAAEKKTNGDVLSMGVEVRVGDKAAAVLLDDRRSLASCVSKNEKETIHVSVCIT